MRFSLDSAVGSIRRPQHFSITIKPLELIRLGINGSPDEFECRNYETRAKILAEYLSVNDKQCRPFGLRVIYY